MNTEVTVLYFAKSTELTGVRSETLSVPQQLSSAQLWSAILSRHPRLAAIQEHTLLAVRQEYVPIGDQLLLLEPAAEVMNESEEEPKDIIKVGHEKLSADDASMAVISPCCGAVSLFLGTTRNSFEGKKVIQLEYEAYTPMAEAEIKKICMAMRKKWPSLKHIAVHHRLGVVPLAEASVIIAVSSPHRKESLDAVQYCIDTLKATVPIWKKEVYEEEEYSWKENKECYWKQQEDPKL